MDMVIKTMNKPQQVNSCSIQARHQVLSLSKGNNSHLMFTTCIPEGTGNGC